MSRVDKILGTSSGTLVDDDVVTLRSNHASAMATAWPLSKYGVEGIAPALSLDFLNGQYRLGKTGSTFADAFTGNSPKLTYSTTSNSTMVNSAGSIVWAPHNLVTYSEDFSNAAWSKVSGGTGSVPQVTLNAGEAPDGTNTASRLVAASGGSTSSDYSIIQNLVGASGHPSKAEVWVKSNTGSTQTVYFRYDDNDASTTVSVTTAWQKVTYNQSAGISSDYFTIGSRGSANGNATVDILIWGAHLYRSDLGGMAQVPGAATGFEYYVPTNGSAEYLPRVGHHVYNGSAWVNEGLLIESEPRTNLVYPSEFPTATAGMWLVAGATTAAVDQTGPDGLTSAVTLTASSTGNDRRWRITTTQANSTSYAVSFYAKAGSSPYIFLRNFAFSGTLSNGGVWWDVSDFSVASVGSAVTAAGSQPIGNGWYRCWAYGTTLASIGNNLVDIGIADTVGAITATSGDTGIFYGAQLEAAPTPSSYMPTNGGTYTRTAQSLTVPAHWYDADNPTPTGPELVTNGTFDADISDWVDTSTGASTLVWNNGTAELFKASGETAAFYQLLTLTVGETYHLTWEDTGTGGNARVGTSVNGQNIVALTSDKSITFTATAANNYLQFNCGTNNATAIIDNISVRQVSAPQFGWPEPEYIGSELLSAFSDASWTTTTGDWTYDAANDEWDLAVSTEGSTSALNHDISVTEGSVYVVTATVSNVTNVTSNELLLKINNTETGNVDLIKNDGSGDTVSNGGDGTYTITFVAGASTPTFQIRAGGQSDIGDTATLVSASVREINPLSVSIQMDGRMTYADEDTGANTNGLGGEALFYVWHADANNYIETPLTTQSAREGRVDAIQRASGTRTFVPSAASVYSPGVLVPFNIASRHGSTFVNGAVDGVALTEDTTPVALPDLSGTNLQIAYDFMGTIGTFRQFAGDIGDAGLETSSDPGPSLSLTFDGSSTSSFVIN